MDMCNSFIGICKFLGVYPIEYDSRNMDVPFRKAKFFLARHILFIILSIFAIISKYIKFSKFQTKWSEEQITLFNRTYAVFNVKFIQNTHKILTILSIVVPLINFSLRDTLTVLNSCAKCTFPCREVKSGFAYMKWLILPVIVGANIQDIAFEMYKVLSYWSDRQMLDSFTCLLRTITGSTAFLATMFLFVCMFSTKEKIKNIRSELKKVAFVLESKHSLKRKIVLPDVEDVPKIMEPRLPVKQGFKALHLKLKLLREQHNNLIFSTQTLNKRFQTDLLFMLVLTFYLLLMCTYGFVFNIDDFEEREGDGLINFFILISIIIAYRLFLCWLVCYGASSIDVESKLLEMAIMRLSLSDMKDRRSQLEVQLFHLQCKNRENPFNIFGMFTIGKSFMFMMLATIISYIAVLIQFTYEAQSELNKKLTNITTNNSTETIGH